MNTSLFDDTTKHNRSSEDENKDVDAKKTPTAPPYLFFVGFYTISSYDVCLHFGLYFWREQQIEKHPALARNLC